MTAKHVPTPETRRVVTNLSRVGMPQAQIAQAMEITRPTLAKHYRRELDTAEALMLGEVVGTLYDKAIEGDVSALSFILKSRAGWRTTDRHEITGADGGPLATGPLLIMPNWVKPGDEDGKG